MANELAKWNANQGGDVGPNNELTRTGIQHTLSPFVGKALGLLPGYDPMNNVAHARRTLRALMTIAIPPLLHMGAPKEFMRQQLLDALDHALAEHSKEFKANAAKQIAADSKPAFGAGKVYTLKAK